MRSVAGMLRAGGCGVLAALILAAADGCRSVRDHRREANRAAGRTVETAQKQAVGRAEPLAAESPADTLRRRLLLDQHLPFRCPASLGIHDLPETARWSGRVHLDANREADTASVTTNVALPVNLLAALRIGARNSREFQAAKESVFRSALGLDLERKEFRHTFAGMLSGAFGRDGSGEESTGLATGSSELGVKRTFRNGVEMSGRLMVDVARLLTQDLASSLGLLADASVSIPLLGGAGRDVVAEPLKQAERDVLYAVYTFETFKRAFAVQAAGEYLSVLREDQQVRNVEENYKRLVAASQRARRLADAGRLPEFQFDQAVQDELRARTRWVEARQRYAARLDSFKLLLGLPPDAAIRLDETELERLRGVTSRFASAAGNRVERAPSADAPVELREPDPAEAGPLERIAASATRLAISNRLDLRVAEGKVEDAQRKVYVAADALRARLTLLGQAQTGERRTTAESARRPDARIRPDRGVYTGLINVDPPLDRTAERIEYRSRLLALEQAIRDLQKAEDEVKMSVRGSLRDLLQAREGLRIQLQAVALADKRILSTDLFLQAGRAQIRDVLESQEALLTAQNALTAAVVSYRVAELALQRDMGVLHVSEEGLWKEYVPEAQNP